MAADDIFKYMRFFEPDPITVAALMAVSRTPGFLGISKAQVAYSHLLKWEKYIMEENFPKKDPVAFRSENIFMLGRVLLLEKTLYGATALLNHKSILTGPRMLTRVVDYEKMLEDLAEAASIYISRYMNSKTHTGSAYNILRMYEAWCVVNRRTDLPHGFIVNYSVDSDSVKANFMNALLSKATASSHNKHRESIINMRRYAQPALDHLAKFQGYHHVTATKDIPMVIALRKSQQNANREHVKTKNQDLGGKHRATMRTLDSDKLNRFFHTLNNFQNQIRRQIYHHQIILSEAQAIFKVMYVTGMRADHVSKLFINSLYLKFLAPVVGATPVISVGIDIPLGKMKDQHNVFYVVDHKLPERCAIFGLGCHFIVMCLTKTLVPGIWNIVDCLMGELEKVEAFQSTAERNSKLEECAYWAYRLFNNPYSGNRDFNEDTIRLYLDEFLKTADIQTAAKMHLPRDTVAQMIFEMYEEKRDHIHVRNLFHQNHDTMSHVYAQGAVPSDVFPLSGWKSNVDFLLLDCAEAKQVPVLESDDFNAQLQSVPEELLDVLVDLIFPNIKSLIKRAEASHKHPFTPEYSLYHVLTTMNHCIRRTLQRLTTLGGPTCTWNIPAIDFLKTLQFFDRPEWVAFNNAMCEAVRNNTNVYAACIFGEAKSREKNYPEYEQRARVLNVQSKAAMEGLLASTKEAMRVQAAIEAGIHFAPVDKPLPVVKLPQVMAMMNASDFYKDWCAKDPSNPDLPSMSEYATGRVSIRWQKDFGMPASMVPSYKSDFSSLKTSAIYLDAVASVKGYTADELCAKIDKLAQKLNKTPSTFLKDFFYKLVSRPNTELIDPVMVRAFEEAGILFPPGVAKKLGKRGLGE